MDKEELKTLKDLSKDLRGKDMEVLYEINRGYYFVGEETLKQEAIKWINYLGITTENENTEENVAISNWIKHFFDIHEWELK